MANKDYELLKALVAKAKGSAALTGHVSNRVYSGRADDAVLPYAVVSLVAPDGPIRCFDANRDFNEVMIQWDCFDRGPSAATVIAMESDLALVLDRQTLTYDTATHLSCAKMGGGFGPVWVDDAWQRSVTYQVRYQ